MVRQHPTKHSMIDFQAGAILVDRQWNAKVAEFTLPKHGFVRTNRHHGLGDLRGAAGCEATRIEVP